MMLKETDIERLLVVIALALMIELVFSVGFIYYAETVLYSKDYDAISKNMAFKISKYHRVFTDFMVGIAIGYWLASVNSKRKILWFIVGALASWWSLLIYGIYIYTNSKNT